MEFDRQLLPERIIICLRAWCFTINNPTNDDYEKITNLDSRYYIFQLEAGDSGTPHYQGYAYLNYGTTMQALSRLLPRANLRAARGTAEENRRYCTKEPRLDGPWENGDMPAQGRRTDVHEFLTAIKEGLDDYQLSDMYPQQYVKFTRSIDRLRTARLKRLQNIRLRERLNSGRMDIPVTVLWGPTSTGKTRHVYMHNDPDDIYQMQFGDGTSGSLWFDDYEGESVLLIDDFYGQIKFSYLLRLLRPYKNRAQTKGYFTYPVFKKVYITSNEHPDSWYPKVRDNNPEAWRALRARYTEIVEVTSIQALI